MIEPTGPPASAPIAAPLPRPIDSSFGARFFGPAKLDVASKLPINATMTFWDEFLVHGSLLKRKWWTRRYCSEPR